MPGGRSSAVLVLAMLLLACSPSPTATEPSATTFAPEEEVATELAPSQLTGSTVPAPETPTPCSVEDLEFWTAHLIPAATTVDAVIRIRNTSDERCDADVSASTMLDPDVESDVWLDAGAAADLVVGQSMSACAHPSAVSMIELRIGGDVVDVPSAVVSCGWWITAFYPIDGAAEPCAASDLAAGIVPGFVVVRNTSVLPCVVGELVSIDAPGADPISRTDVELPAVTEMAGGDVIGWPLSLVAICDSAPVDGVLVFETAEPVPIFDPPCRFRIETGAGRPWYGAPGGPLDGFSDPLDLEVAFRALDPFDRG